MLFFTNICIAVQWIERARSIAMLRPPRMDMCAPKRSSDRGFRIAVLDREATRCVFFIPQSAIGTPRLLKNLWMPIGFLEASFAGVFEKFVHRGEQHAGAFHVQTHTEIELVVEKMNISVPQHAKEAPSSLEIVGMNNSVLDLEVGARFVRDAISAAGDNEVQNSRKRPENRDCENIAVVHFHFSMATHRARIAAQPGKIIRAVQEAVRRLVVVVQISQERKIDVAHRDTCVVTGIVSRLRDVSISTQRAGKKSAANIGDLQPVVGEEQSGRDAVKGQRLPKKDVVHSIGPIHEMDSGVGAVHPCAAEPATSQSDGSIALPAPRMAIFAPDYQSNCRRTLPFPVPQKFA